MASLNAQPIIQPDTVANDSSLLLNFANTQIDTVFAKYKIYKFQQTCAHCEMQSNKEFFLVETNSQQLITDINLYLSSFFSSAQLVNQQVTFHYTPNDYFAYGSGSPQAHNYLDLINAKQAWDYTTGNPDIKIGFADKGCRLTHEDLVNKITTVGFATLDDHGTWVAGCIAAESNNGKGISAIGYNCSMLYQDLRWVPYILNLVDLANAGADVISCSWQTGCSPDAFEQGIINELYQRGITIVISAGNGNNGNGCPDGNGGQNGYTYPSSYDHVLSITGVASLFDYGTQDAQGNKINWKDVHTLFADNPGHKYWTHNDKVDLCAPGWTNITTGHANDAEYVTMGGTSFAAPVVAGTCGLLLSINPCFTPDDIENILKSTAFDSYSITENQQFTGLLGAGRLDAEKACSLATALSADHVITTGQNLSWSGYKIVAHKLTIQSGATLTISGTVNMGKNARIIIERGGKLVLDGAVLTTGCHKAMWEGIEVWGNPTIDQRTTSAHGWLEIKNGSVIEHARDAIYTGRLDTNHDWVWSHTGGGIIQAFNSTFRNNGRTVQVMSFHNPKVNGTEPANVNIFRNCVFETTAPLRENLYTTNGVRCASTYMVTVWDVKGMRFHGNTFRNTALADYPFHPNALNRLGGGVLFYGASCIFNDYTPCLNCTPIHNTFKNLYRGIDNKSTNNMAGININNCTFTNVDYSITLDGGRGDKASGNTFDTDNQISTNVSLLAHLQALNSSGFLITGNLFKKTNGTPQNSYGAYLSESNTIGGELYKNTFRDVVWGLETNQNNQNLTVQCNDFDNLWRDWNSNRIGINDARPSQEIYKLLLQKYLSPNNQFDNNCIAANKEHIFNTARDPNSIFTGKEILYYYNGLENRAPSFACVTTATVDMRGSAGQNLLPCLAKITETNEVLQNNIATNRTAANGKMALINGGNTNGLLSLIADANTNNSDLYALLLGYAPFLSDEVLVALINRPDFDDRWLFDILLPHTGLSATTMLALDGRMPPLAQNYYDSLLTLQDSIAPLDTLMHQINALLRDAQLAHNELLRNYEDSGLVDSIIYQLSLADDVDSKGRYIHQLIEQDDLATATTLLTALNLNEPAQADLYAFETLHHNLRFNGLNWFGVTEPERENLRYLSGNQNTTALHAQAVLMLIEDTLIYTIPDTSTTPPYGPVALPLNRNKQAASTQPSLFVYPNPFTHALTIDYRLATNTREAIFLKIYNMQGKLVKELPLGRAAHGKTTLYLPDMPAGVYILQLLQNNVLLQTQKLIRTP